MIRPFYDTNNDFSVKGASWIGEKFRVDTNGDNIFYNALHEIIKIKEPVILNNSWVMYYSDTNNLVITATVTDIKNTSFIGITDSVATITLSAKDTNNNTIQNQVNNYQLRLSKNYGLISIMNFYRFPFENQSGFIYSVSDTLNLIGISNPLIGWQNITSFDIYNWNVGWEFHSNESYNSAPGPSYSGGSETHTIRKIIGKTLTADSVNYLIDRCKYYFRFDNLGNIIIENRVNDTIIETYYFNSFLNKLSFEPFSNNGYITFYYKTLNTIMNQYWVFYDLYNDTCQAMNYDGTTTNTWGINMGSTYVSDGFSGHSSYYFVYYKKDSIEWGIPYICTTLLESDNIAFKTGISIYPNPTNDILNIVNNNTIQSITVFNTLGEKELYKKIENASKSLKIDISFLQKGIYFIKIDDALDNRVFKVILN